MKRSEINQRIEEAIDFFEKMNFKLPSWGYWILNQWIQNSEYCEEIFMRPAFFCLPSEMAG